MEKEIQILCENLLLKEKEIAAVKENLKETKKRIEGDREIESPKHAEVVRPAVGHFSCWQIRFERSK